MDNSNFNFSYVSAKSYAKKTGLSYDETLKLCKTGKLEAYETDGGQWRIKIYKADTVSREEYDRLIAEKTRLETVLSSISQLVQLNSMGGDTKWKCF